MRSGQVAVIICKCHCIDKRHHVAEKKSSSSGNHITLVLQLKLSAYIMFMTQYIIWKLIEDQNIILASIKKLYCSQV